jgi:hypothetical protein
MAWRHSLELELNGCWRALAIQLNLAAAIEVL